MLKQYHTYRVDFSGRPVRVVGGLMGIYLFLTVLYHFFLSDASRSSAIGWIVDIVLPVCLSVAMIVLLCVFRMNAPGVYGILGAAFCVLFVLSNFSQGNILRILLAVVWYLICGLIILMTSGGLLPEIPLATAFFLIAMIVRALFFDLGKLTSLQWIPEIGVLSAILALAILPIAFQKGKIK